MKFLILPLTFASLLGTSFAEVISVPNNQEETILQYFPESGKRVEAGEIIAVFDCVKVVQKLKAVSAEIPPLEKAVQKLEKKVVEAEALKTEKLANATYDLKEAEEALNKYIEADAPAQELALKADLTEAEAAHKVQEERYNTRDQLLAEGFIRKIDYANEETAFKRSAVALDVAKLKLTSFEKYEKKQTAEKLDRAIKQKKEALSKAEAAAAEEIAALRKEIQENRGALQRAEAQKEQLEAVLRSTVIRAKKEGILTGKVERGATVRAGQAIGQLD